MINSVVKVLKSISLINYAISHFTHSLQLIQSWINNWFRWRPTSAVELDLAEKKVLSCTHLSIYSFLFLFEFNLNII